MRKHMDTSRKSPREAPATSLKTSDTNCTHDKMSLLQSVLDSASLTAVETKEFLENEDARTTQRKGDTASTSSAMLCSRCSATNLGSLLDQPSWPTDRDFLPKRIETKFPTYLITPTPSKISLSQISIPRTPVPLGRSLSPVRPEPVAQHMRDAEDATSCNREVQQVENIDEQASDGLVLDKDASDILPPKKEVRRLERYNHEIFLCAGSKAITVETRNTRSEDLDNATRNRRRRRAERKQNVTLTSYKLDEQ